MGQSNWTFEGTSTAQLQAIHDALAASFTTGSGGTRTTGGILQSTTLGRQLVSLPIKDRMEALSMLSNELARRNLPNRDEILDTNFGNGPARGGLSWGQRPW